MPGAAIIAGFGPGFCEAFARKLAREGYPVGMFARSSGYLADVAADLREEGYRAVGVPTDVTDPDDVADGFARVREEFGPVSVLAHTASTVTSDDGSELDPDRFERLWRVYTYGGLLCFRTALDDLRAEGGTALFFGGSPTAGDFAYKSGKDAARGLARALAERYGPAGIHVAHIVLDSPLLNPDVYESDGDVDEANYVDPAAAAETCYHLIEQPDRGRTFELDLHATDRSSPR